MSEEKVKTLDEMDMIEWVEGEPYYNDDCFDPLVNVDELREEARKWVEGHFDYPVKEEDGVILIKTMSSETIGWIKHFFNLEEGEKDEPEK